MNRSKGRTQYNLLYNARCAYLLPPVFLRDPRIRWCAELIQKPEVRYRR